MLEKDQIAQTAARVAELMQATFNLQAHQCHIKKNRTFNILANHDRFTCTLELDISFDQLTDSGYACNKAEILLLPEELPAFSFTLKEHAIPLPADCNQKLSANPRLISYYIETMEPPEHFARRLSAAFKTIEPLENRALLI